MLLNHKMSNILKEKRFRKPIKLNVGGSIFRTTWTTLTFAEPNSMLARMFNNDDQMTPALKDEHGNYFLDRSPKYFEVVLDYLRSGEILIDSGINPRGT